MHSRDGELGGFQLTLAHFSLPNGAKSCCTLDQWGRLFSRGCRQIPCGSLPLQGCLQARTTLKTGNTPLWVSKEGHEDLVTYRTKILTWLHRWFVALQLIVHSARPKAVNLHIPARPALY